MVRLACAALVAALAACGTTDDRPATLPYITETILKPTCASAQCHSTFARAGNPPRKLSDGSMSNGTSYSFETVDDTRAGFQGDAQLVDIDKLNSTEKPTLIINLTEEQTTAPRMPYDAPLPNADIDLIQRWLDLGLPGICAPGAATACLGPNVRPCTADGAYDLLATATICPNSKCADGACQ